MSIMSRFGVAASLIDFAVKRLLFDFIKVDTVAATGSLISDAAPLKYGRNVVTAANGTKAVRLPKAELDSMVEVVNTVSNQTLIVFPELAGDQINAITAGASFSQAAGSRAAYYCDAAGHWYVAAANLTGTATSASQAELDVLDGATAANNTTGKAAILGTDGAVTFGGSVTAVGSFIIGSADMAEADLEKLDGITNGTQAANKAVVADANVNTGVSKVTQLWVGASGSEAQVTATPAELNYAADVSANTQTLTAGGAGVVATTTKYLQLDNAAAAITATIANANAHQGLFTVKAITEPAGGQDHTVTLTAGTWNGTNTIATFADINDALVVVFDSAGNGTIVANVGTVGLSGP